MTPEESKEYKRQWRLKRKDDPEYQAKRKAESERYYQKHQEKINQQRREKYHSDEEHRARIKAYNDFYTEAVQLDPNRRAAKNERQRQRYAGLSVPAKKEIQERQQAWLQDNPEKYAEYQERKNAARRQRYREHLLRAVALLGGKCSKCGLVDHPIVYDFHHREPEKKSFNISQRMGGITWERLTLELLKCDLLCSHCHRKTTYESWDTEGVGSSYWDSRPESASEN